MRFTYPAPAALVYEFFYLLPTPVVLILTGLFVLLAAGMFVRTLIRHQISMGQAIAFVLICLFCSWPLMVTYWPENIEIVVGIFLGFGLYLLITGRSWASVILIGIAAAVKIFPFAFLALFFQRKQYKQMIAIVVIAGAIDVLALWAISSSIAVSSAGIAGGLRFLQNVYVLPYNRLSTALDHSIFALIKGGLVVLSHPYPSLRRMVLLVRLYTCVMLGTDLILYFARIRFLPLLNQVLCFCILAILTTPMSLDYTLMHLYVPWGMLVLLAITAWRKQIEIPGLKAAFFCFLLLFCTLSEITYKGWIVGGHIKCLVLISLLIISLRYPFVSPEQPSVYAPA